MIKIVPLILLVCTDIATAQRHPAVDIAPDLGPGPTEDPTVWSDTKPDPVSVPCLVLDESNPPQAFKDEFKCQGESVTMQCPAGRYIKILDAFYGRKAVYPDYTYCTTQSPMTTCGFDGARTYVQGMCEGKEDCSIYVGSPVPFPYTNCYSSSVNIPEYLQVRWTCCVADDFLRGCVKRTKAVTPWVTSTCRAKHPIYIGYCQGTCPSSDTLEGTSAQGSAWDPALITRCKCCRTTIDLDSMGYMKVLCTNGDVKWVSVLDVKGCACSTCWQPGSPGM